MSKSPIKPLKFRPIQKAAVKIAPKASPIKPATGPAKKPSQKGPDEMLYYGFHACQALFKNSRDDIVRAYCTEERVKELSPLLKWCAANKKAYHIVTKLDLERLTESVHHEGMAILAKRKVPLQEKELLAKLKSKREPLVILDQVVNPHNVGAIMRVMAHFGWKHIVTSELDAVPLSSSAARISEGGFEYVDFTFYKDQAAFLRSLKSLGYQTVGTAPHAKKSLYAMQIPTSAFAFFLGNEVSGLSEGLVSKLDLCVSIPSTGCVQSLNVAMASGLVIGEYVRQHGLSK